MDSHSEGISETSYWINFFINASIPAADSAQYAMMFADNRMDKSMLMDLNKEYLNDVGIKRLGDVIAVLKHAKDVHKKLVEEQVMRSREKAAVTSINASTQVIAAASSSTHTPNVHVKRDSPMSRIVGRCLAGQMSTPPSAGPSPALSQRLSLDNVSPTSGVQSTAGLKNRRNVLIPITDAAVRPAPTPLPTGVNKKTVFDRLGGTKAPCSTSTNVTTAKAKASSDSVFSRLGGKKRGAAPAGVTDGDSDDEASTLQYAGVLLPTKKPRVSPVAAPPKPAPAPVTTTGQPRTSEGILGSGAGLPKRLRDRLGNVVSPADTTDTEGAPPSDSVGRVNLKITAKNAAVNRRTPAAGVKSRLDIGQGEVSSSSDHKLADRLAVKPSILARLGKQP